MSFVLDDRLALSCIEVGDWPLSRVLLKNNADYPWCILVPRVASVVAMDELSQGMQQQLMREISALSTLMRAYFVSTHINVGALGLIVSQLHIHVVGRSSSDPLWPQGIWQSALQDNPYCAERCLQLHTALRELVQNTTF